MLTQRRGEKNQTHGALEKLADPVSNEPVWYRIYYRACGSCELNVSDGGVVVRYAGNHLRSVAWERSGLWHVSLYVFQFLGRDQKHLHQ
jgi:hypothetical protein